MKPVPSPFLPFLHTAIFFVVILVARSDAASIYIGDVPDLGEDVEQGTAGPDTANGGNVTYAFFEDGYFNDSGASVEVIVSEVHFWAANTGMVIPFVAKYGGGGGAVGADYEVLAIGDAIDAAFDLNNAAFEIDGVNPTVVLDDGETLIAGFTQDTGIVTWLEPGDADADFIGSGNLVPDSPGQPLSGDAGWTSLGREYRFNIGIDVSAVEDGDGDGLPDQWEIASGLSPDDDGSVDPANGPDGDPDGDGLTNSEELEQRTHPTMADTDGDGLNDGDELAGAGSRPPTNPTLPDTDGDGLSDQQESGTLTFVNENDTGSNPTLTDTDEDTLLDGDEVFANNAHSFFSDPNLRDTDGDGFNDDTELRAGSDPADPESTPEVQSGPETVILGDVPDQGLDVESGSIGPDTAGNPAGNITYAFFEDSFTNETNATLRLKVESVAFWALAEGEITPYVARYNGGSPGSGDSYEVLAIGDPIMASLELNQADFLVDGVNPVVTVDDGQSLIAGFHSSVGIVPWEEPAGSDGDYIAMDNVLPETPPGPLAANAGWSDLGREYRFNVLLRQDNPQDILLSFNEFLTSFGADDVIGRFRALDGKAGAEHVYSLVEGEGSSDNAQFSIMDDALMPAADADFAGLANGAMLTIRVRAEDSDAAGRFVEKVFDLVAKLDADADGLPDDWEARWAGEGNLALLSGLGDADADGDGLSDLREYRISIGEDGDTPTYPDIDPTQADADGDTLTDDQEVAGAGERPSTNPALADTDGDGLDDLVESNTGVMVSPTDTGTDPANPDTDGDLLSDGDEVNGSGPNNYTSNPHLQDTDGDGFSDKIEIDNGSNPDDPGDLPDVVEVDLVDSNTGAESWETAADWSDAKPAGSHGAYTVPAGGLVVQTPGRFNPVFPGVRLTIGGNGSRLHLFGEGTTTIDDLRLGGGSIVHGLSGEIALDGGLLVSARSSIAFAGGNSTLRLASGLSGSGRLVVTGANSSTVLVSGSNPNFTGGWDVTDVTLRGTAPGSLGTGSIIVRNGRFDVDYDMEIAGAFELEGEGVKMVLDQDIRVGAFLIAGTPVNEIPGTPDPNQTVFDQAWFEAVQADFILEGERTGSITVVGLEPPPAGDLVITSVEIVDGHVRLRWRSVEGEGYDVSFSPNLTPASFTVIGSANGEPGDQTTFSDPDPIGDLTEGYYRVRGQEP